jgi:hypothetical protein
MAVAYTSVGSVIILGSVKPYEGGNKTNNMEVFSEVILVMIMYTMMLFTDFVPDLETRQYIGYVSIVLVAIHLLVCFSVMIIDSLRRMCDRVKWFFIRRKNIKIMQEIQATAIINPIKPITYRIDIVQEVDSELEESGRSPKWPLVQSARSRI